MRAKGGTEESRASHFQPGISAMIRRQAAKPSSRTPSPSRTHIEAWCSSWVKGNSFQLAARKSMNRIRPLRSRVSHHALDLWQRLQSPSIQTSSR